MRIDHDMDVTCLEMSQRERDHVLAALDWYTQDMNAEEYHGLRIRDVVSPDGITHFAFHYDDVDVWHDLETLEPDGARYFWHITQPVMAIVIAALTEYALYGAVKGD